MTLVLIEAFIIEGGQGQAGSAPKHSDQETVQPPKTVGIDVIHLDFSHQGKAHFESIGETTGQNPMFQRHR